MDRTGKLQKLQVSRLISDHMILQHGKPVHLWGTDAPGRVVCARLFADEGEIRASGAGAADVIGAETDAAAGKVCAEVSGDVGADGGWSLFLPAMTAGKTIYTLAIEDDTGVRITVRDVVFGAVWFASGQSNMDLTMERARDRYPDEIRDCENPYIRTFKITEHAAYGVPLTEPLSGEWRSASPETILDFSATGYFFAKHFFRTTGIPVGFLHASLGGSRIAGWMSREMLAEATASAPEGYPQLLAEAARYADGAFLAERVAWNEKKDADWNAALTTALGATEADSAHALPAGTLTAGTLTAPCFFKNITELREFSGCISLKRRFVLTGEMLRAAASGRIRLFLGTMVDRDETWINGVSVGETGYQYPPRRYDVPLAALHEGENEIEIRLVVENSGGRLTPGKRYSVFCEKESGKTIYDTGGYAIGEADGKGGEDAGDSPERAADRGDANILWEIDLAGEWRYQVLATMPSLPETDFVNWHPTGLWNGMAAPCTRYTIGGFLWYQGESNTHLPEDYEDLQRRLMRGWRRVWHTQSEPADSRDADASRVDPAPQAIDAAASLAGAPRETLAFLYVQLPNFRIDLDETGLAQWTALRKKQAACLSEPAAGMVDAWGLGDDNDLHPHEKEEIGRRLAALAGGGETT